MAPPQKGQINPSRYLIALGAIFVVLFAIVLGFGSGSLSERLKPKLGLDLIGGTSMTLVASETQPSKESMELARSIMEQRVNGSGVAEAEVVVEGANRIVISAPGDDDSQLRQLGAPAQLRFRKVLDVTQAAPSLPPATTAPTPSASASASASGTPKPTGSATPTPTKTATATPTKTATPAPTTAAPSATPSTSGSAGPATFGSGRTEAEIQAAVLKKLGIAWAAAQSLQAPASESENPDVYKALEPFRTLDGEETAMLPVQMQYFVPQVTCKALGSRPAGSIDNPKEQVVACQSDPEQKQLLDVSKVEGRDIAAASAGLVGQTGSQWGVDLTFSGSGTEKWTLLTREAFTNEGSKCSEAAQGTVDTGTDAGKKVCRVAVVLDNSVVSAPSINGVLSKTSQISGSFNKTSATLLANQLKYGALPLSFEPGPFVHVSATLGTDYLRAGLLAAGVGMLLVIVYAFFYYRLLGLVIMLSLLLSALLTFGMLVFLGRQIGFTLTLAGIAGFIVSLGVAADSFVIYFERLKDEIRDGRSPRSAVPRAWLRARRTIITANMVTFLAALTLWLVGVGSVQGFAFALGLATVLDLIIVFLFRHPMMTLLARTPAFLSPRVSGLGRVLHHATEDTPTKGSRPARPKEA